jgi:hypothetical protein
MLNQRMRGSLSLNQLACRRTNWRVRRLISVIAYSRLISPFYIS